MMIKLQVIIINTLIIKPSTMLIWLTIKIVYSLMKLTRTRLDRFISQQTGIAKNAVRLLLAQKKINVNGLPANSISQSINPFDQVIVNGKQLPYKTPYYVLFNKPKGVVSATYDKKNKTVIDVISHPHKEQLHIAGRLDFNTTGLMLLTNDGYWSRRLSLPELNIQKHYLVTTEKPITEHYCLKFLEGIDFSYEGITTAPALLKLLNTHQAKLALTEGRYHQVKRMFGYFDNKVIALHRFAIGELQLPNDLPQGSYTTLNKKDAYALLGR